MRKIITPVETDNPYYSVDHSIVRMPYIFLI